MSGQKASIGWIRDLAKPYLRGYRPRLQRSSLLGYWFLRFPAGPAPAAQPARSASSNKPQAGFFVGYLLDGTGHSYLAPQTPECVVFAFVHPVDGALHRRLVRQPESLFRKTFDYIRWLTHRPPRFEFYESELPALIRRISMRDWPREKYEHYSRNFFTEALAWLVRSGLVRRLLTEAH